MSELMIEVSEQGSCIGTDCGEPMFQCPEVTAVDVDKLCLGTMQQEWYVRAVSDNAKSAVRMDFMVAEV